MKKEPRLTESLLVGRRELDDVPGYERLADVSWQAEVEQWALRFRLHVPVPAEEVRDESVPEATDWYALIASTYPAGPINVYPAAQGGLVQTYAHQSANLPPRKGEPWRQGNVCVATPARGFERFALGADPHEAPTRLRWHVARTRSWVEAARRGELLRDGEPFELPIYESVTHPQVVFDGAATDLVRWAGVAERFGFATLLEPNFNSRLRVVQSFSSQGAPDRELVTARWGSVLQNQLNPDPRHRAAWIRCDALPTLPPWRSPDTWRELTDALVAQGVDLLDALRRLAPGLRDEKRHLLLIGAPVSRRVGEPPVLMHWIALQLPEFSKTTRPRNGFRAGEEGAWRRDQAEVFAPTRSLGWVPTGNWAPEEIATRGRAAPSLREAQIVLIGAGALGSALAELLVREGVTALTILDEDTLTVGNLVRHTLTLADVGSEKASGLAQRLNLLSPYAQVQGINHEFPGDKQARAALAAADMILDTTGSDALLQQLTEYDWTGNRLFVSIAIGFFARRVFFFAARGPSFPYPDFADAINPWLLFERDELGQAEMPWEGTGCWHPVFPARASDFALAASVALRQIEASIALPVGGHELHVTEQAEVPEQVLELRRASLPAHYADA